MKVFALLPYLVSAAKLGGTAQVEQMRETFKALAKQIEADPSKLDASTRMIVGNMLDQINGTLVPALIKDSDDAQDMIDTAVAAIDQCLTNLESAEAGVIAANAQKTVDARKAHVECRSGTAAEADLLQALDPTIPQNQKYDYDHLGRHWSDYDTDKPGHDHDYESAEHAGVVAETTSENASYKILQKKCDKVDNHVASWTLEKQEEDCQDTDAVNAWFVKMNQWTIKNARTYKEDREECHEARHNHQHRVYECNQKQKEFEETVCSECTELDRKCYEYRTCYRVEEERWNGVPNGVVGIVEELEETFIAQQFALECLLCYGEQILANKTDLSACEGAECVGCDDLKVNYTVPHELRDCPEDPEHCRIRPCETEWCDAEYGQFEGSCTPVAKCTECPVVVFG